MAPPGTTWRMAKNRFRVEAGEERDRLGAAQNCLFLHADLVIAMFAHDVRVILAIAENIQPGRGTGTCECRRRRVNTAPLRTPDRPDHVIDCFCCCEHHNLTSLF